ncbi:MAG: hypothetical protein K2J73_08840 [Oscillospiraceae bacterium]|nr:hypothetical protein [Oscillospiraceae bacterium]
MNIDLKRKKEKRNTVIRWILYILLTVISYIYMTTAPQKLLMLRTPLFIIPMAMCVAMFEEPFDSAIMGCTAGLLLDTAQGTLIGLSGIIMLWCCLGASLLFHFFMRRHIINIIALNAAAVFAQGIIHYFFYYAIWEYDSAGKIFTHEFLPVMTGTIIAVIPFFFIVRFLSRRFGIIDESYIEEKSDDIVRE